MRYHILIFLIAGFLAMTGPAGWADDSPSTEPRASSDAGAELETILAKIETRYAGSGFAARFSQASTLKAMDITDTATGRILIKRPDEMRWEYETPERQTIITDGVQLWMYRPDDKQVMVGQAPTFFGDGKGAGFLADMQSIRANFTITLEPAPDAQTYRLRLVPVKPQAGLADILLSISRATFEVTTIVTHNEYEDETRIDLSDYRFNQTFDDALFRFETPPGVDVLKLDEE
jgi:outer membrane lipoprotein carrier protein